MVGGIFVGDGDVIDAISGVLTGVVSGVLVDVGGTVGTGVVTEVSNLGIASVFVVPHSVQMNVRTPSVSVVGATLIVPLSHICPVGSV